MADQAAERLSAVTAFTPRGSIQPTRAGDIAGAPPINLAFRVSSSRLRPTRRDTFQSGPVEPKVLNKEKSTYHAEGMEERTDGVGGFLEIESIKGPGTGISAQLSIARS